MKWVAFLLVAANLGFAAFVYVKETSPDPDAQIMKLQMNADQINIVTPRPVPPPAPAAPEPAPALQACMEWGSFDGTELARAQTALEGLALGERLRRVEVGVPSRYWVYIAPLKSRVAMERKVDELRKLGIAEFFPVLEPGRWQFAISLGVFRNEDGARKYLETLHEAGVRSARIGEREQRVTQAAFLIREPTDAESDRLVVLAAAFTGAELKAVQCPAP